MQREVVLVLGKTGSGKTTWARNFIKNQSRVIILDAGFGDYPAQEVFSFNQLLRETERQNQNGSGFFRLSYTPRSDEYGLVLDAARITRRCWILIEEADRLENPKYFREYDEVISRGRHYELSILAVSLYPFKLPADLRRQATRIICYRMHEPRDIDYLYDVIGDDVSCLPDLPPFSFLDWSPGGSKIVDGRGRLLKRVSTEGLESLEAGTAPDDLDPVPPEPSKEINNFVDNSLK